MMGWLVRWLAEVPKINASEVGIPTVDGSGDAVLQSVLNTVYFVAGVTAVIVIIVAGYSYVTSSGDSSRVARAKNAILYAAIGLAVVLAAFMITQWIIGGVQE